jgi:hypothetical protein
MATDGAERVIVNAKGGAVPESSNASGWIQTWTGRQFFPLNPRIEEVCIRDIAKALSNLARSTGHCDFYSVAQHSCIVSDHLLGENPSRALALWGLMHDASEAYLNDIASPVKRDSMFAGYRFAEARLMKVIVERFSLWLEEPNKVRDADLRALATEARDLMKDPPALWDKLPEPLERRIRTWSPRKAERQFLKRFRSLGGHCPCIGCDGPVL